MHTLIPWIFAAVMLVGVLYLLLNLVFGGGDADIAGDVDIDNFLSDSDGEGVGCSAISSFMAGFGAMGLLGTLSGWNILVSIGVALIFGLVLGRFVIAVLRMVYRQQSTALITPSDLVGSLVRVTVNTPAGKTGEGLLEGQHRMKYPIRDIHNSALQKGDYVEVVEVKEGRLYVKKKRTE